ncbi:Hpt domain-containing protein, partial [Scytonema sp. NUACC21]
MLPEQQQRILGYFIEEAKDHLNTIEQGLLNLQSTLNDPEMVNEVFRAAHSIKGGAAMLGLSSIQRTAHRLEDCFKILKEHPIKVDQKLESLFLGVLDTLKALLEHLQRPFGLTEETANTLMSETEPVFTWLHEHLELLVQQGSAEGATQNTGARETAFSQQARLTESERRQNVQAEVLQILREMLQIFKQGATKETRQTLEQCCHKLAQLGEASDWSNWCSLCRACGNAIANPENTYLTLAKIVITDLKQGLELVLSGREPEIAVSQQLQALTCLEAEIELLEIPFDLLDESANTPTGASENSEPNIMSPTFNVIESADEGVAQIIEDDSVAIGSVEPQDTISSLTDLTYSFQGQFDTLPVILSSTDAHGPEVGIAELNTLADLFEGESSDLDDTWDNEEVLDISNTSQPGIEVSSSNNEDFDSEFEDLFFQEEISNRKQQTKNTKEELGFGELFGDFIEEDNVEPKHEGSSHLINVDNTPFSNDATVVQAPNIEKKQDEIGNLLELKVDDNELLTLGNDAGADTEPQPSLELVTIQEPSFDDLFIESANLSPLKEITLQPQVEEPKASLQKSENLVLDELFDEAEPESEIALSNHELISNELLDTLPGIEDGQLFWHQETEEIQNEIDSLIEEDAAQQLEKMLYAAADEDIFSNSKQSPESISDNLNLEDLESDFQTEEQDFDFLFLSESDDDLFEELTLTDSTNLSSLGNGNISSHESSGLLEQNSNRSQPSDTSNAPPPEGLELSPEFTHSSQETTQANCADDVNFLEVENNTVLPDVFEDTQAMDLDNPFTLLPQETTENLFSEEIARDEINSQETPAFINLETDLESLIDIQNETILQRSFADFDFTDNTDSENPLEINSELDFLVEESNEPEVVQSSQELQPVDDASEKINEEILDAINEDNLGTVVPLTELESSLEEADILLNIKSSDLTEENAGIVLDIQEADFSNLSALFEGVESKSSESSVPTRQEESEEKTEILEIQESNFSDLFANVDSEEATDRPEELVEQETQLLDTQAANLSELLAGLNLEDSSFIIGSTSPEVIESTAFQEELAQQIDVSFDDEFAELDKLLEQELASGLDAVQQPQAEMTAPKKLSDSAINSVTPVVAKGDIDVQFQELEEMVKGDFPPRPSVPRTPRFEQLMKVPVKHLDDLSNLVGELVVNRNTLEQDQERMRQSLDNLLHQVQQLSDVGARMQELYERSLLEASLLASRKSSSSGLLHQSTDRGFTELEMDRFTPFHSLSQEMIELIVRVREAA